MAYGSEGATLGLATPINDNWGRLLNIKQKNTLQLHRLRARLPIISLEGLGVYTKQTQTKNNIHKNNALHQFNDTI